MSDQTTIEVVLSSESTVGNPIIETVTVLGTVPIGPRGIDGSGSGLVDGDYGDVIVSGSGTVMTLEAAIARDSEVTAAVAAEATARDAAITTASTADRARANHTGTQLAATISDLTETVQDVVGAMATDGTTVNFTYDDTAGTLTAEVQGLTSASLSDFAEAVRDRLGSTLVQGTGITVTVDDPGDTVTIATTITQYTDEMAQDAVGAMVSGNTETGIAVTYDDAANKLNFVAEVTQTELDAAVADLISGDGSIETIVALTQAEYDAIGTPDPTTYYIITDATGGASVQSVDGLTGDVDLSGTYVAQADAPTTAWVEPSLGAGWSTFGTPYEVPRYRKWLGMVTIQGLVQNTSGGALGTANTIFTLPSGFRPRAIIGAPPFAVTSIEVTSSGAVQVNNSSPNGTFHWLTLTFVPG